ncbi:MAG: alpha/beta hydrolase [Acetobacteraceae bacterium]|nr:alpha/beta hydrolase [Acetobacteraceae bacterium]
MSDTATTALARPTSERVTIGGLELRYLDWGNPAAPPLVCVHGYTSSADAFNGFARHFRDRFHIVALDVRGHGESAWSPDGAYTYRDQAGDLAAFVDRLGLGQFILLGTSMGGVIAMTYAMEHGQRLRALVLNDIGPDAEQGSQRITQMVGARPDAFATLDDAMVWRRDASPIVSGRTAADQRELALGLLRERPDGKWGWKMDPAYISQRVERGAPVRPNLWPALARLACPTLVVWGTGSDVLSETQARRMVETLPKGELLEIPGVAHAPCLVEPASLAGLEHFLHGVPAPTGA